MKIKNKKGYVAFDITIIIIAIVFLLIIGILVYAYHIDKKIEYETYIEVSKDLDDANKCLYQCGFIYPMTTALENYKFCTEKCDRINERNCVEK